MIEDPEKRQALLEELRTETVDFVCAVGALSRSIDRVGDELTRLWPEDRSLDSTLLEANQGVVEAIATLMPYIDDAVYQLTPHPEQEALSPAGRRRPDALDRSLADSRQLIRYWRRAADELEKTADHLEQINSPV